MKLPKIEGNHLISKANQQEKIEIREKDVSVINLYSNQIFVAIIQHPSLSNTGNIFADNILSFQHLDWTIINLGILPFFT